MSFKRKLAHCLLVCGVHPKRIAASLIGLAKEVRGKATAAEFLLSWIGSKMCDVIADDILGCKIC